MRQEIIDTMRRLDYSALVDIAVTFNMIDHNQLADFNDNLLKASFFTNLRKKIKQRALADENIAEYVLLY